MARKRRRYDDKFRASAVVLLEAAGYPDKEGALAEVSRKLGVPQSTLHGWANATRNPPPSELRTIKKQEITEIIRTEIYAAMGDAPNARPDASYKDLITGAAILIDKLQLLEGKPTGIIESRESPLDKLRSRLDSIAVAERERNGTHGLNGNGSRKPPV